MKYSATPGNGEWLQMDNELDTRNGQTVGTRGPTGHNLLVDVRLELPYGMYIHSVTASPCLPAMLCSRS